MILAAPAVQNTHVMNKLLIRHQFLHTEHTEHAENSQNSMAQHRRSYTPRTRTMQEQDHVDCTNQDCPPRCEGEEVGTDEDSVGESVVMLVEAN